jgi:surface protein
MLKCHRLNVASVTRKNCKINSLQSSRKGRQLKLGGPLIIDGYSYVQPVDSFITTWDISSSKTIELPLIDTGAYNCTIDWGDETIETITSYTQGTHTYTTGTIATITITGTITGWSFGLYSTSKDQLLVVNNFGTLTINNYGAFNSCTNLTIVSGIPTLIGDIPSMFIGCINFNSDISNWNTSQVTTMDSLFLDCNSLNTNFSSWDVSQVTNMFGIFDGTNSMSQSNYESLKYWNVSNITGLGLGNIFSVLLDTQVLTNILTGWKSYGVNSNIEISFNINQKAYAANGLQTYYDTTKTWTFTETGTTTILNIWI